MCAARMPCHEYVWLLVRFEENFAREDRGPELVYNGGCGRSIAQRAPKHVPIITLGGEIRDAELGRVGFVDLDGQEHVGVREEAAC